MVVWFRLGKGPDRMRPMKIVQENKALRKVIWDNAKCIQNKAPLNFRRVIISKDLKPLKANSAE